MPYTYKKEGNKYCVYNKNTGKKVGCTKGSIKKYLGALHANVPDAKQEELKSHIKSLVKELLKEEESRIMRVKAVKDELNNVLNKNVGLAFDNEEKRTILFKQGTMGIKSTIQRKGNEESIKFSTTDMYGNNKINIIKKLKNMSDPATCVYANFFSVLPTEPEDVEDKKSTEQPSQQNKQAEKKPEKEKPEVYIKLSQPFDDTKFDKITILGDFIQQLDIK